MSRRRACRRRTWSPPRGRRGNPMDRNCSGRACGRRARGTAPGGSVLPPPAATSHPPGSPRQRARNIGVRRSSSAQSASSPLAAGSSFVATVAAMRNLAGRRFSATARYQDKAPQMAGSSQTVSLVKSLMGPAPAPWRWPAKRDSRSGDRWRLASKFSLRDFTAPGICSCSACAGSCGSAPQGAC